jgi:hypothetical protein
VHHEPRDAPGDVGADVDLRFRLHLAARRHGGDEVAPAHVLEPDLRPVLALGAGAHHDERAHEHHSTDADQDLLAPGHVFAFLSG